MMGSLIPRNKYYVNCKSYSSVRYDTELILAIMKPSQESCYCRCAFKCVHARALGTALRLEWPGSALAPKNIHFAGNSPPPPPPLPNRIRTHSKRVDSFTCSSSANVLGQLSVNCSLKLPGLHQLCTALRSIVINFLFIRSILC